MKASSKGHSLCVQVLLEAGVDVNIVNQVCTSTYELVTLQTIKYISFYSSQIL
jgi:predicted Fe-Mo cluster-binding NifX family protein